MNSASRRSHLNKSENEDDGKENIGCSRCVAHAIALKGIAVDVVDDGHAAIDRAWAPCVEYIDFGKQLEGANDGDDRDKKGGGGDQGQGDLPEALPGAGTIHLGRLIEFMGYILQTSQENDHVIAHALPDTDDDDIDDCPPGFHEPVGVAELPQAGDMS